MRLFFGATSGRTVVTNVLFLLWFLLLFVFLCLGWRICFAGGGEAFVVKGVGVVFLKRCVCVRLRGCCFCERRAFAIK